MSKPLTDLQIDVLKAFEVLDPNKYEWASLNYCLAGQYFHSCDRDLFYFNGEGTTLHPRYIELSNLALSAHLDLRDPIHYYYKYNNQGSLENYFYSDAWRTRVLQLVGLSPTPKLTEPTTILTMDRLSELGRERILEVINS